MTILDLITTSMKRVSGNHGGEYHGPCPLCGGTDRFHIWPDQGDKGGTFWCRGCDKSGDGISYLKLVEGLSCPDAFGKLGLECNSTTCPVVDKCRKGKGITPATITGGSIPERASSKSGFTAPTRQLPAELWQQKAGAFVDHCHQALLDSPEALDWLLRKRGITRETAITCRLGINRGDNGRDYYRPRSAWGLPDETRDDGKLKKLWIPRGLVIPRITGGIVDRIRVRRPDDALKSDPSDKPKRYIVVPGSTSAPLILPCTSGETTAWIIVESELDAILLWQLAGDLVGVIAMGNSSARPDVITHNLLIVARHISVALDYDARTNSETGRYENPGGKEVIRFWLPTYPRAERTPLIGGKDPCDAWLNGIDLRAWALAGLPPAYRITNQSPEPPTMTTGLKSGEDSPGGVEEATRQPVYTITAKDGRRIHITDDPTTYAHLAGEGKIVFDSHELALVKLSGADQDQAARFIDAKQIFPGIRVESVRPDTGTGHIAENHPRYRGKFERVLS